MKALAITFSASCGLLLAGCVQEMQQLNKDLGAVNTALAGGSTGNYGGSFAPTMTAQQESSLNNALSTSNNGNFNQAKSEASNAIRQVIARSACDRDTTRAVGVYRAPGYTYFGSPLNSLRYHPKGQCLTVARIDGWEMPARNALRFRVLYTSDASGETRSLRYELTKQPEGEWLFQDAR